MVNKVILKFNAETKNALNKPPVVNDLIYLHFQKEELTDYEVEQFQVDAKLCSSIVPDPFNLTSNQVKLHFVTDYNSAGKGFRVEWQSVGCGGILTHPNGTISTPNYPNGYPLNLQCNWTIQAPPGYNIEINFQEVDLETSSECSYDFIKVRLDAVLFFPENVPTPYPD